jgi:biopolymer transport protein ExbD
MSGRPSHRTKKEIADPDPEFQVAPMADLLFVLLVFFMSITTTEVLRVDKSIDLPVAKDGMDNKNKTSQVVVNISWLEGANTGAIKIDEVGYSNANSIVPVLKQRVMQNPTMRVLIRADRGVQYHFVAEVMRACSEAQISNVTFSVMSQEGQPG